MNKMKKIKTKIDALNSINMNNIFISTFKWHITLLYVTDILKVL